MIAGSGTVESVLLILKIGFLVLLYLVIWRILRAASREVRGSGGAGQESMILSPQEARRLLVNATLMPAGKLVVMDSPTLEPSSLRSIGNVPGACWSGCQRWRR